MNRKIIMTLCAGIILLFMAGSSMAEVNVNIGIGVPVPPLFSFPAPPEMVVIPGTYAYFAPGIDTDILFYGGYWYRPYRGYWYRSNAYNGPWRYMVTERIPRVIIGLPGDFRTVYRDHPRIPYGHLHKSWSRWEKDKYWDKRGWKHDEKEWKHERKESKHEFKGSNGGKRDHYRNGGGDSRDRDRGGDRERHGNGGNGGKGSKGKNGGGRDR